MQDLNGTHIWHYVNNEEKIEGTEGNVQYLVCVEQATDAGSTWHMQLAYWFSKGDKFTIVDTDGMPHRFDIVIDGFYTVNEFSDGKSRLFFRIPGVRYWTNIMQPGVSPEEVLTIL